MAAAVMSPARTPIGGRSSWSTPTMYVSPSTRQQTGVSLTSPASFLPTTNEDEKERQQRRRSKILELHRKNLGSPGTPTDRVRATPLIGLTSNQLSDHYSNCIKLSAENKINSKNAFGLHLIDYMTELLKRKELDNFQVASSTLDASAKIYAGRVDAVYTETYKVLSTLGHGADMEGDEETGGENLNGDEEEEKKKKKKSRNSKTVETNLKNININKLDLAFEVDPLFQVMSAAFDDGGTAGLLMNSLRCLDDSSTLVFDSSTVMIGTPEDTQANQSKKLVDMTEIKDIFRGVDLQSLHVCPHFADFRFTEWDHSEQDFLGNKLVSSDHAFDLNAEPEPLPEDPGDDGGFVGGDDYPEAGDHEFSDTEVFGDGNFNGGQSREHIFTKNGSVSNTVDSIKGTVDSLIQVLAAQPSDYSYFNSNLLQTWAGPSHWKLKPASKDATHASTTEKGQRKKKEPFKLKYDEEMDFDKELKKSKAATLTKATLKKYKTSRTTLPVDLHYDADKLLRLSVKPDLMIKRQSAAAADSLDDGIENYDYDNINDRQNYCPRNDISDDDDDQNDGNVFNLTDGPGEFSHMSSQDLFNSRSNSTFNNVSDLNGTLNGTLLTGDNLIAQPNKVAKIEIGYAKTAKRVDVKRLKSAMWGILKQNDTESENKENQAEGEPEQPADLDVVQGTHTFKGLIHTLPQKISKNAAKNLSVPIAFVCLLHLANEKTLKIVQKSMEDLVIEQDSR